MANNTTVSTTTRWLDINNIPTGDCFKTVLRGQLILGKAIKKDGYLQYAFYLPVEGRSYSYRVLQVRWNANKHDRPMLQTRILYPSGAHCIAYKAHATPDLAMALCRLYDEWLSDRHCKKKQDAV